MSEKENVSVENILDYAVTIAGVAIRLHAGRLRNCNSIFDRYKRLISSSQRLDRL